MSVYSDLGTFCFRGFRHLIRLFPLSTAPWLGGWIGRFTALCCERERRVVLSQLKHVSAVIEKNGLPNAPEIPDFFPAHQTEWMKYPERMLYKIFADAGEFMGETLVLDRLLTRDSRAKSGYRYITSSGQDTMLRLTRGPQAVLALSAHLGCFELLAAFHAHHGIDLVVIGRDPNYQVLSTALRDLRKSYGVDTIWRDESSGARKLLNAVRKPGKLLGALIDQDTNADSHFVPFFGLDTSYPVGPVRIALRQKLPIVSSFIVRIDRQRHHVITRQIDYDPNDPGAPDKILREYSAHLEDLIIRFPSQWLWWHRRWRRRPGVDYSKGQHVPRKSNEYCAWLDSKERLPV